MRQSRVRFLAVVVLFVVTVLPLQAAPRRDQSSDGFFHKIVQALKKIVPLEEIIIVNPKP